MQIKALDIPSHIKQRIPAALVAELEHTTARIADRVKQLPESSEYYVNQQPMLQMHDNLPGIRRWHLETADMFFDIHSALAGHALLKWWRVGQLLAGFNEALGQWNLTVAASLTRGLVETAVSTESDTTKIISVWKEGKRQPTKSVETAATLRRSLYSASIQFIWGTRLSKILESVGNRAALVQRTNILTLIDRAAKEQADTNLSEDYEILCDAVHPSWGASECFWTEAGKAADLPQLRVLLKREAIGQIDMIRSNEPVRPGSRLPYVILTRGPWAFNRFVSSIEQFEYMCRDICLTARIYLLENLSYYGLVKPTGTYDLCSCGSGIKTRFCRHEFGEA